jgi:hypothetical protein
MTPEVDHYFIHIYGAIIRLLQITNKSNTFMENFNNVPPENLTDDKENTKPSSSKASRWLKRSLAVGAAALVGTGIYEGKRMVDEHDAYQHSPEGILQEAKQKAEKDETINREYTNALQAYYDSVNNYESRKHHISDDVVPRQFQARAKSIEIAKRKGFDIHILSGSDGMFGMFRTTEEVHASFDPIFELIPVSIEVDGKVVPLSTNDYSEAELNIINSSFKQGNMENPMGR